jgi:uncharacterized protein YjiS (DUF1127 family)
MKVEVSRPYEAGCVRAGSRHRQSATTGRVSVGHEPFAATGCTGQGYDATRTLREACRHLWRARRTHAELSALSDPELRDMGLFRGDIGRVAVENYR